ncbi:hypothetical protein BKN38_00915 [Helicobacter sp. CLO-3]|uniref:hypothetical protein n=1 Tax=unclassified Helicobacter TaxID=2593540 RepID=UPI0008055BB2|nr:MULTISPECIES: hypothetical protein [unclassified Helicobacter]OBV29643.1 hypothetical protein BA723_04750 [Helicobacter sp. CLO-3]OHU85613.1 hypothetical protein BKN38_00915 [Helicobacter sp. CLO-3]
MKTAFASYVKSATHAPSALKNIGVSKDTRAPKSALQNVLQSTLQKAFATLLALLFCANLAHALESKKILDTLKKQNYDAKIISTQDSGIKGLSIAIIEQDKYWIPFLVNEGGDVLIGLTPDTIIADNAAFQANLAAAISKVQDYNKQQLDEKVIEIFKQNAKIVLEIAGKNSQKTTYIVLDTNCPYCKQEVDKIDEYLKEANLKVLIVGALSQDSVQKAATFAAHLGEAKTNEQKIAYLKKAFEKTYKSDNGVNIQKTMEISAALGGAGIRGVPYIIKR